jgi:hypothetical protein
VVEESWAYTGRGASEVARRQAERGNEINLGNGWSGKPATVPKPLAIDGAFLPPSRPKPRCARTQFRKRS